MASNGATPAGAPQRGQNRLPGGTALEHDAHVITAPTPTASPASARLARRSIHASLSRQDAATCRSREARIGGVELGLMLDGEGRERRVGREPLTRWGDPQERGSKPETPSHSLQKSWRDGGVMTLA